MTGGLFGVSVRALALARDDAPAAPAPGSRAHKRWSEAEDAALRAAWPLGGPCAAAGATGRTPLACSYRAWALGMSSPNVRLVFAKTLAKRIGVHYSRVANIARAAGVSTVACVRTAKGKAPRFRSRGYTPEGAAAIARAALRVPARLIANAQGSWGGPKPCACLRCWTDGRPHKSRGLCARCERGMRAKGFALPQAGSAPGVRPPAGLGPAAGDVVTALAGSYLPLAARVISDRSGRFREQVRDALRALIGAGVVRPLRDKNGHRRFALAIDAGARWWAPEAKRRAA